MEKLADCEHRVSCSSLPPLWLRTAARSQLSERPSYECPLYATSARRGAANFIMMLKLPSADPQAFWARRGCAALCDDAGTA